MIVSRKCNYYLLFGGLCCIEYRMRKIKTNETFHLYYNNNEKKKNGKKSMTSKKRNKERKNMEKIFRKN